NDHARQSPQQYLAPADALKNRPKLIQEWFDLPPSNTVWGIALAYDCQSQQLESLAKTAAASLCKQVKGFPFLDHTQLITSTFLNSFHTFFQLHHFSIHHAIAL